MYSHKSWLIESEDNLNQDSQLNSVTRKRILKFKKDIIAIRVEMLNLRVKDIFEMNKQENDAD